MDKMKTSAIVAITIVVVVLIVSLTLVIALDKADNLGAVLSVLVPAISALAVIYTQYRSTSTTHTAVNQQGNNIAQVVNGNLEAAVKRILVTCVPELAEKLNPKDTTGGDDS